jgi:hypothetical protein
MSAKQEINFSCTKYWILFLPKPTILKASLLTKCLRFSMIWAGQNK